MAFTSPSGAFGSIVPSQVQQALATNYLTFDSASGGGTFAKQYLPEIYESEVERYGNRTLSGFLRMVGAEMPMTSDQVIWSEQNRLHIAYNSVSTTATANQVSFTESTTIVNVISVGSTVVIMNPATGAEAKCYVSASTAPGTGTALLTLLPYTAASLSAAGFAVSLSGFKIFVYGSEYSKGSQINSNYVSVAPSFTQYSNSPIIIRSKYTVNGSDTAQIGWVDVATEDGATGYLWYLKAASETRLRFEDYLEMSVVEGELAAASSAAIGFTPPNGTALKGTQGLFAAIKARGNQVTGFSAAAGITNFDAVLKNLDTQGAIEENMLFLNRQTSLDFDDMLAALSSGSAGGVAYGLFENSEQMSLNLGFTGFRRGSYDFYKTDWKYLNDASTRGAVASNAIDGVLIPAGTSTVYDEQLGTNIRRPFLHVRYRASQADDRRMKSWTTGSVGGAYTSDLDAMEIHFLSERCLCVQAANNFVLFTA